MIHTIEFFMFVPVYQIDTRKFIQYDKENGLHHYSKGINFSYNFKHWTLTVKTTAEAVIGRTDITINDYAEYADKLTKIVSEVVERDVHIEELKISRIDYKVDIPLTDEEMKIFKQIKDKHYINYKYMSQKVQYDTSVHLKSPKGYGQCVLNSYSKFNECMEIKYFNVWRVEIEVFKSKIRKNLINYGISRELSNYWTINSFNENYFELLKGYYFLGDYYRLDVARNKIRHSDYSKTIKDNLCKFVTRINRYGMTGVKGKYYNYVTMKKYCELLDNIDVNPVTIDIGSNVTYMENILKKCKRIVEEKYFV